METLDSRKKWHSVIQVAIIANAGQISSVQSPIFLPLLPHLQQEY